LGERDCGARGKKNRYGNGQHLFIGRASWPIVFSPSLTSSELRRSAIWNAPLFGRLPLRDVAVRHPAPMWANPGVKRLDEMLAKIFHESLCAMAHEELHTPQTAARLRAITSLRWFWSITVNGPMIDGTRGDPGGAKAQFQKTGTRRRCGRSWED
jgi:hypothetical protein